MKTTRLAMAFSLALFGAATLAQANGKPSTTPVGPPTTPVERPTVPPADPPDSLIEFVCSILPVPYLCD
ncbi:MAG TPA: hypothetical protein VJ717_00530 [Gemmatimonadaceae bacterium]|nr:hypothetical protein [Gemmatimonadaceae bacterium]